MAVTRYHGRHGSFALNGTVIVGIDKWDLDMEAPMSDATGFGDENQIETIGIPSRKGTYAGYFDSSVAGTLLAAIKAQTPVDVVLTPTSDLAGQTFAGPGWITGKWDVSAKDTIKVSGKFSAAGAWTDTIVNV